MIDRFRRRPNQRDREAIEREIAKLEEDRRDEIKGSWAVILVFGAVVAIATPFVRNDLFHSLSLGWSSAAIGAFFAVIVLLQIFVGLPASERDFRITRSYLFDRKQLRDIKRRITDLRAALSGEVYVLRCDATDVIAFGDDEEDADYYAYQVAPDRVLFFDRFDDGPPYSSFEVVSLTADASVYFTVHGLGKPLRVRKLLPATALPAGHDVEATGRLDDLIAAAV